MADTIDRRTLIGAFAAATAILVAPDSGWAMPPASLEARLAALAASEPRSAHAIGRAYLATHPTPGTLRDIHAALCARLRLDSASRGPDNHALADRIDAAIRADFAHGDTVTLSGWVMSKTELQLCALAALGC